MMGNGPGELPDAKDGLPNTNRHRDVEGNLSNFGEVREIANELLITPDTTHEKTEYQSSTVQSF